MQLSQAFSSLNRLILSVFLLTHGSSLVPQTLKPAPLPQPLAAGKDTGKLPRTCPPGNYSEE